MIEATIPYCKHYFYTAVVDLIVTKTSCFHTRAFKYLSTVWTIFSWFSTKFSTIFVSSYKWNMKLVCDMIQTIRHINTYYRIYNEYLKQPFVKQPFNEIPPCFCKPIKLYIRNSKWCAERKKNHKGLV